MAKILVVDDHPSILRLVAKALEVEGHEILTAMDGVEGWEKVQSERPDLVILDVVMPRLDGYRVLNRIKSAAELQHTPVMMLTVKDEPEDVSLATSIGADYYMTKPFNPSDMASLVRRIFETWGK
jgi:DNA-binding response OmpR family regulator